MAFHSNSAFRLASTFLLLSLTANVTRAQLSLSSLNTTVTINFDSTISGVNNGAFTGAGFQASPTSGQLDSDAWAATGWSNGSLAFGGTQVTAATDYTRGNVAGTAVTTGGFYSSTVSSNVSLMIQPGGSDWAPGTLTLRIQNNTGSTVTTLNAAYDLSVRNDQGRSSSLNFSYSTDDTTYTPVTSLNYTSTTTSDASGITLVTSPVTSSPTSITLSSGVVNGGYIYVRWSGADVAGSGSRDEFYLDNIAMSVSAIPEPSTYAAIFGTLALVGTVWHRRRQSNKTA